MTYEKSADDLEQASHLQEQLNLAGRKACEAALVPQASKEFDGVHCVEPDCDEVMPPIRLAMGRIRCTTCQVEVDRRAKLGRK